MLQEVKNLIIKVDVTSQCIIDLVEGKALRYLETFGFSLPSVYNHDGSYAKEKTSILQSQSRIIKWESVFNVQRSNCIGMHLKRTFYKMVYGQLFDAGKNARDYEKKHVQK